MKLIIGSEQHAKRAFFVRPADLLPHVPANFGEQLRAFVVVPRALNEELDSLLDPMIPVPVVVELDGHVIGQVVCLEIPNSDVVWLNP